MGASASSSSKVTTSQASGWAISCTQGSIVIEGMAGLIGFELTDKAVAQQVEVANGIENLVLDEFVFVAQAIFIQHAVLVNDNGVVTLPPLARPLERRYSISCIKPKVRARLTSLTNEVLEKSISAVTGHGP